jgi:hypothetical protein
VTKPYDKLAREIAVEEAILKPFRRRRIGPRPIGGPTALLYS